LKFQVSKKHLRTCYSRAERMTSRLLLRSTTIRNYARTAQRFKSTRPEPSSLSDQASSFLAGLRWKAANALTASLSESERQQLLEQLHPAPKLQNVAEKKETDEDVMTKSIAEAVAEAKAQEAQRLNSKWEKEKATIMKEAERAAQARVESDLAIQKRRLGFEQWQKELEKEQSQDSSAEMVEREIEHHPLLGPALIDLGYKRIHVTNAQTLASIPVWKKQRIYRHDRAKEMAKDKMKTLHLGMPGVIGLHEVRMIGQKHYSKMNLSLTPYVVPATGPQWKAFDSGWTASCWYDDNLGRKAKGWYFGSRSHSCGSLSSAARA